jgi:hypothetical protein
MSWMIIVALLLIGLTWLYTRTMRSTNDLPGYEPFLDYFDTPRATLTGPDGVAPEMAAVNAGPLLDNMLTPQTGLSGLSAGSCYAQDRAVELQLGGQYAQRTNNYRREYPDNCSAPLSDFVDSMYKPRDGVGLTVPCAGQCQRF